MAAPMMAMIFDVDDTLYERRTSFIQACEKTFGSRFQIDCHLLHASFSKYSDESFEDSMNHVITMDEMYIYRIQKALEDFGFYITAEESLQFQHNYAWFQTHITLNNIFADLFDYCKENGVFLGLITNGTSTHQREKCDALGLGQWFPPSALIASGDLDINKPDPAIFQAAAKRWNLDLASAWYIGDSLEHDIQGACAAGWHSIWLDRRQRSKSMDKADIPADVVVYTEDELAACIKALLK